jgi:hypothetical protein
MAARRFLRWDTRAQGANGGLTKEEMRGGWEDNRKEGQQHGLVGSKHMIQRVRGSGLCGDVPVLASSRQHPHPLACHQGGFPRCLARSDIICTRHANTHTAQNPRAYSPPHVDDKSWRPHGSLPAVDVRQA